MQLWKEVKLDTREEWLEWRRGGIGASDAPVIMDESPWKTPLQLYNEKALGIDATIDNPAMKRGREMEEEARGCFEKLMNIPVFPMNLEMSEYPFIKCSLDGMDMDGTVCVEIKCPSAVDHDLAYKGEVPKKYFPQCQHQLMVTGLSHMFYFSYNGKSYHVVKVMRDEEYIEVMKKKEIEFWNTHVLAKDPPPVSPKDCVSFKDQMEWSHHENQLIYIREEKKYFEELEKKHRDALIELCVKANTHRAMGNHLQLTKSVCEGSIDYAQALKDNNIHLDLSKYRRPSFEKFTIRDIS